ncbi:MAG: glycosyltransferase [Paracoccus sp. (in: a-proteobacteria)]|uniref:glycosyltransferase n=1 Tax=unclassified Paracoccus (in: a-proteobacteria) TaxID=2688777 RepID=UPI000C51DE48|nr:MULTISPECIES: glycosyltransferase [unclassified Paracoccus (in: a-proteobacteria)]MAN57104.1 glycosyl transferase family 1 [Paracoccus sp. (in: a-proteobacteria)]MBA50111.1 glycosyl transferase family 1 [Paracoccus sp. (in: a-proteobacteria)]MDB2551323.1 glycosyltransferase [Paracoccus sp. (in: a-proteobacteria)]HIC65960.1 glycosyltransferase [Paracoccus sp. (in: a-proteobacteria)]|tara:strand:- start:1448 stop:2671 length:1224 start_codon:yes stop_codon:yes gene_type:complete
MKILFVHQNFPGQFPHLSGALARRGHQVLALTDENNERPSPVRTVRYKAPRPVEGGSVLGRTYSTMAERGLLAARGARALRDRHGFSPDLIIGHSGWGETLFLKEIWPQARLLVYAELMYRTQGHDVGFDPEFQSGSDESRFMTVARSAHLIQGIAQADAAIAPTRYQADSFPPDLRGKITVIHDGIDTARVKPDPEAWLQLPGLPRMAAGDEIVSFVSRSLEPYRGFHIFMRALPDLLAARPRARVVIVGGDGVSYGGAPPDARSWKEKMLAELGDRLDLSRVHMVGRLAYPDYLSLIQIARVHCYLTYPFVLSWSLTEAMAAGGYVVASDTAPVRELVRDGENARLVPFFDVQALSAALIRGLEGDRDAARLRQAARQTILDGYDLQRISLPRQIEWVERQGAMG